MRASPLALVIGSLLLAQAARAQAPTHPQAPPHMVPKRATATPHKAPPQITVRQSEETTGDAVIQNDVPTNPWPEIAKKLRAAGCDLVEARLSPEFMGKLLRGLGLTDAAVKVYRVKAQDKGAILVVVCRDAIEVKALTTERLPGKAEYLALGNLLILRVCPDDDWALLCGAMTMPNVEHGTTLGQKPAPLSQDAKEACLKVTLQTLRNQIELFRIRNNGALPDLAHNQWQDLIAKEYLRNPPRNPFSPQEVWTKVVVAKSGTAVDPKTAGWAFDPEKGTLYAAGSAD
jgi:hypothetical protein